MHKLNVLLAALIFAFILTFGLGIEARADKTPNQLVADAKAQINEVTVHEVMEMINNKEEILIVDIMDKHEFEGYDRGPLPGAVNISRGRLEFYIPRVAPDRDTRIVVYCRSDLRGPLATKTLNDFGYVNAVNLIGGLKAWNDAGYPSDSR